ncbi:MAG: hypothetical protein QHJ82_09685 [Verrucomicrobiota bacterium]|nr:hypothetical protein [Verrucomicrobiota bacterium]
MKMASCVSKTAQLVAALLITMLTACDQQQVRTYRAPKDPVPPAEEPAAPRRVPVVWKEPPEWQPIPTGPMRAASFVVNGPDNQHAEISVVPLSDQSGSDLDNFNRWRAQLGLPPGEPAELERSVRQIEIGGQQGKLIEIAGPPFDGKPGSRIIVAMVQRKGTTWFFKMMGDDALVAAQKPAFIGFLGSVQYAD